MCCSLRPFATMEYNMFYGLRLDMPEGVNVCSERELERRPTFPSGSSILRQLSRKDVG